MITLNKEYSFRTAEIIYRWPDDQTERYAEVVITDVPSPEVLFDYIDDAGILFYTESLDDEYVSEHFDGLEIVDILTIDFGNVIWLNK